MLVIRAATNPIKLTIESEGNRLMVARLPAGGSTSLAVGPPLTIHINNPEGVEVEYDGRPVALPAAGSAGVELTIGPPRGKS